MHWGGIFSFDETPVPDFHCPVRAIASNTCAFAAILEDGSAIAWGHNTFGGSSRIVQGQLKNVQQIKGSFTAFAAILANGSVVTWGGPEGGGDSRAVQDRLRNVQQIQSSDNAFAALMADGTVASWGCYMEGLDTFTYLDHLESLKNVTHIQSTKDSFAALNSSGEVYVWGSFLAGNNMHKDKHLLGRKVLHLAASRRAFAAICEDGTITSWGENDRNNFFGIHPTDVEISCKVVRSKRMILHLLQSLKMDQLLHGALLLMALTAKTFKISSRTSNSLLRLRWPSVQSLVTGKLSPGVVKTRAATAVEFNCLV